MPVKPRGLAQKQILTPSLLQMVTVLQLNRLELKEMINQEIVENPVLEESAEDAGEEITPEELMPLLEGERVADPNDQILEAAMVDSNRGRRRRRQTPPSCSRKAPRRRSRSIRSIADGAAVEAAGRRRSVRRDRFRLVLRRLSRPRLQESYRGNGRKALVRDISILAGHSVRSSAIAAQHYRACPSGFAKWPTSSSATWMRTAT